MTTSGSRMLAGSVILTMTLPVVATSSAESDGPPAAYHDGQARRISVGLRLDHFWLEESRRPGPNGLDNANLTTNFLGSLWGLDSQQSYVPSPFVEYRVFRGLAVGLEYDTQRAKTLDWADEDKVTTAGDGDVEIRGVQAYASWRVRLNRRWMPYASVGYSRYWSRFFVSPGWAGPGRYFVVEDTDGWSVGFGCRFTLDRRFGVDAGFRHLQVGAVDGRAYLGSKRYRGGAFPMRSDAINVALVLGF